MSKASNINSLSELRSRREEIKTEQETARQGLTSTLATAPSKARDYALEDLALPALGIGLAVYIGYRVLRSNNRHEPQEAAYAQPPQHLQQPQRSQVATAPGPSPSVARAPRAPRQEQTRQAVKSSFNFASLISAGKLLIPAAQAIMEVIQDQKPKA